MNYAIVGGGPVGLCAALGLAKTGISVTVIESNAQPSNAGSRAIVVDKGSLYYLRHIGCLGAIRARGLVAERRKTFFRGRELYANYFPKPGEDGVPLFVNIPQTDTEAVLLAEAEASPNITILWGNTVTGKQEDDSGIVLDIEHDGATSSRKFDYVVACDGCRSPMRNMCGLEFPGTTNPYQFLIVDVRVELPFPREHHFHFNHPENPGHTTLIVPQPENIWRLDWQLPIGVEPDLSDEAIGRRVEALVGTDDFELVWKSCYRFHQRLVTSMQVGRVFFAGDSAHLVNPFGARGMNSGIQDVWSLVEKSGAVMRGVEPLSHLQTYSPERLAANRVHQRITSATMKFIAPTTPLGRLGRNAILWGSQYIASLRSRVDSGKMSMIHPETHPKCVCSTSGMVTS